MKTSWGAVRNNLKYYTWKQARKKQRKAPSLPVRVEWVESVGLYLCHSTYEQREIPKNAGFQWNPVSKFWYTRNSEVARRLYSRADRRTQEYIRRMTERAQGGER